MPRDGSGVYTLPAGNPVVTNTIIASAWANNTLSDIAAQLNNVYTRDGTLGPTGPFKIMDGTVNAPGIAFNSEPGLGFWRSGAGAIKLAQGGATIWAVTGQGSDTFSGLYPKAPGGRGVWSLSNVPTGTANGNQLNMEASATGYNIAAQNIGTGTSLPFLFSGGSAYRFDNAGYFDFSVNVIGRQANAAQIWLNKGADGTENVFGSQVNGVTQYRMIMGDATVNATLHWQRYLNGAYAGTFLQVNRTSGKVTFGEAAGIDMSGPLTTGYSSIGGANGMGFLWDGGDGNYLAMGSGLGSPWSWQWTRSTGVLRWLNNNNTPLFTIDQGGNGNFVGGLFVGSTITAGASIQGKDGSGVAFGPGDFYAVHQSPYKTLQWAAGYAIRWNESNGTLEFLQNNGIAGNMTYQGHFGVVGNMTASNGQIAMAGNGLVVNTFGGTSPIYSNVVNGSPGGMFQCMSMQHTPGTYAAIQLQVGGNNFTFNSNGTANAVGAWVDSDSREKANITAYPGEATAAVLAIPIKEWDRAPDEATGKTLHQVGWVAQDVLPHFPKAVNEVPKYHAVPTEEGDLDNGVVDDGLRLTLDHGAMTALLWKAFQELTNRITQLENA